MVPHTSIASRETLLTFQISPYGNTQAEETQSYSGLGALPKVGLHLGRILNSSLIIVEPN